MNGYVIADFKGVKLSTSESKTIKGIYKSLKNAYELKKPVLCANIDISETQNELLTCFGNVLVSNGTYSMYVATAKDSGVTLIISADDSVSFSIAIGV